MDDPTGTKLDGRKSVDGGEEDEAGREEVKEGDLCCLGGGVVLFAFAMVATAVAPLSFNSLPAAAAATVANSDVGMVDVNPVRLLTATLPLTVRA